MHITIDNMIKLIFSCKHNIKFLGIKKDGVYYEVDNILYIAV